MACNLSTGYVALRNAGISFVEIFEGGCMEFRTGPQPATADLAPTGDVVARLTRDGGVWVPGNPANGLRYDMYGRDVLKRQTDAWQLTGNSTGTIGWVRILPSALDPGITSVDAPRIDGACGLTDLAGDIQFYLPLLTVTPSTAIDINYWWFTTPPLPGE